MKAGRHASNDAVLEARSRYALDPAAQEALTHVLRLA
jgi:hypothetical protein